MQQGQRLSYLQPDEWAGLIEIMVYIVNTWKISTLEEKLKKSEIILSQELRYCQVDIIVKRLNHG